MTIPWPRRTTPAQQRGVAAIDQVIARRPSTKPSTKPADTSLPYAMSPPASADEARQRVQQLVEGLLPDGVDEGTGAALDKLITSWTAGWLAGIDAQHADRTAAIDQLIGTAKELVADARAAHDHQALRLEIARQEHGDARRRLGGMPAQPVRPHGVAGADPIGEIR